MARPSSVQGLCAVTGASFPDFLLPCHFCLRFLTCVEKALFDACPLQLQWRDNCAYGCCQSCIRHCAFVERSKYFERKVTEAEACSLLESIDDFLVRCGFCMRTLGPGEKIRCCFGNDLNVIRGQVRGVCGLCRLSTEA
uniref:Protein E6 n=2 Tax=Acinonyx jubatus papillomavirus type 1 TaxID=2358483 RepID=A0A386N954_9PAPI|nr:E6 [Acinonyx jubatus papillomavirus type 1]AYE19142.1 E6 [Acinonyx jubatus papillomavirus type 1]AYE19145.1 E6 [Acinonyx jubatus papillomavirus type 1]AYE19148.1 E6 [Acinonyx jubatus papillomavirus type 1]AYE19151.1 E6 [Acinonyx jubatus papillomavirus type 1]